MSCVEGNEVNHRIRKAAIPFGCLTLLPATSWHEKPDIPRLDSAKLFLTVAIRLLSS